MLLITRLILKYFNILSTSCKVMFCSLRSVLNILIFTLMQMHFSTSFYNFIWLSVCLKKKPFELVLNKK